MSIGTYPARASDGTAVIAQVAIDDSPSVEILAAGKYSKLQIKNMGADTVYLGNSAAVTSGTGYPLASGEFLDLDDSVQAWWGICGSGDSCTVAVIHTGTV